MPTGVSVTNEKRGHRYAFYFLSRYTITEERADNLATKQAKHEKNMTKKYLYVLFFCINFAND